MSMGTDTKGTHYRGGGALEVGDHRLFEDGCERGGALVSDLVLPDTAKQGCEVGSERAGVSMGIDTKANALGRRRTPVVGSASP